MVHKPLRHRSLSGTEATRHRGPRHRSLVTYLPARHTGGDARAALTCAALHWAGRHSCRCLARPAPRWGHCSQKGRRGRPSHRRPSRHLRGGVCGGEVCVGQWGILDDGVQCGDQYSAFSARCTHIFLPRCPTEMVPNTGLPPLSPYIPSVPTTATHGRASCIHPTPQPLHEHG